MQTAPRKARNSKSTNHIAHTERYRSSDQSIAGEVTMKKAKKSFALRLQMTMVKETIEATAKSEKDTMAKRFLNKIIKNM